MGGEGLEPPASCLKGRRWERRPSLTDGERLLEHTLSDRAPVLDSDALEELFCPKVSR
jgi:hypothetical protein